MMELFSLQLKITLNRLFTQVQVEEEDVVVLTEVVKETRDQISNKISNSLMDKDLHMVEDNLEVGGVLEEVVGIFKEMI